MKDDDVSALVEPLAECIAVIIRLKGLTLATPEGVPVESTYGVCREIARETLHRYMHTKVH